MTLLNEAIVDGDTKTNIMTLLNKVIVDGDTKTNIMTLLNKAGDSSISSSSSSISSSSSSFDSSSSTFDSSSRLGSLIPLTDPIDTVIHENTKIADIKNIISKMFLHEPEKWINKEGNNKLVDNIINGFKPEDSEEDRLDRLEILRALIDGGAKA